MVAHTITLIKRLMLQDIDHDGDFGEYVDAITTLGETAMRGAILEACAA